MSGVTKACLKVSGNSPFESDALMICVMGPARISRFSFTSEVGMGSREHDLDADCRMSVVTSLIETGDRSSKRYSQELKWPVSGDEEQVTEGCW